MEIHTAVFHRIVEEAKQKVRDAARRALADTMEETYRFGWGDRQYVEDRAEARLDAAMNGDPWKAKN